MMVRYFPDELRLVEPSLIGAEFILHHGSKRIHLVGQPSDHRDPRNKVNEIEKRRAPGLDEQHAPIFSQNALHFFEGLLQIGREVRKMVQTALNDEYVLAASLERKLTAVGDNTFRGASVLSDQPGRKVHAFRRVNPSRSSAIKPFPRPQKSSTISVSRGH